MLRARISDSSDTELPCGDDRDVDEGGLGWMCWWTGWPAPTVLGDPIASLTGELAGLTDESLDEPVPLPGQLQKFRPAGVASLRAARHRGRGKSPISSASSRTMLPSQARTVGLRSAAIRAAVSFWPAPRCCCTRVGPPVPGIYWRLPSGSSCRVFSRARRRPGGCTGPRPDGPCPGHALPSIASSWRALLPS